MKQSSQWPSQSHRVRSPLHFHCGERVLLVGQISGSPEHILMNHVTRLRPVKQSALVPPVPLE